ncbi:OsmC family protein [Rhodococcus sp. H29-C3]|uniref:OsmC family protein n=1 Tax=Rhodococcus sp. H29-C3 TaxID=3046307 RepID=UPI0024B97165|nr:OsmC family protein [Rhodococcus sp. H29-C3]MDJ0363204.1 OsmC family protein [Rhodococcus sp. H29-C3]
MSGKTHKYDVSITWTGNYGAGTKSYTAYGREHEIDTLDAPTILGTSDPAFRGDPSRWNPEQLQVAALSQCHMLWYLNLAAAAGVVITAYADNALGVMTQNDTGAGQFEFATLRPRVTITADSDKQVAMRIHSDVPAKCFIARSVNFPVHHEPVITTEGEKGTSQSA